MPALGGVCVPLVALMMQAFGWRVAAIVTAVLFIAVGWPLSSVIRSRPEDHGETVDGEPKPAPRKDAQPTTPHALSEPAKREREFTLGEALRTRAFWLISLGHGSALLVVNAVNVHAITHMKNSLGYTVAQASLVITLMTAAQIGGVGLGWLVGDRFEKRRVAAICMLMHAAGLLMLTYGEGVAALVAFSVLHGVAWGLRGPFMQAIRADYFGRRSIGMIMGLSAAVIALGQVGGPMIAGVLGDATGNYRAGFTVLAAMAGLGSLTFLLARPPRAPSP
jgi:sugar phosphate permease